MLRRASCTGPLDLARPLVAPGVATQARPRQAAGAGMRPLAPGARRNTRQVTSACSRMLAAWKGMGLTPRHCDASSRRQPSPAGRARAPAPRESPPWQRTGAASRLGQLGWPGCAPVYDAQAKRCC